MKHPMQPASLPAPRPGLRALRWSLLVAAATVGPLLLCIVFGPADGNPIGLGLPAALVLLAIGLLQSLPRGRDRSR